MTKPTAFQVLREQVPKQWHRSEARQHLLAPVAGFKAQWTAPPGSDLPGIVHAVASLPALVGSELGAEHARIFGRGQEAVLSEMGLPSYERLPPLARYGMEAGTMLAQLPVPAKAATTVLSPIRRLSKPLSNALEWFTPWVDPKLSNYIAGTALGGTLMNAFGGMDQADDLKARNMVRKADEASRPDRFRAMIGPAWEEQRRVEAISRSTMDEARKRFSQQSADEETDQMLWRVLAQPEDSVVFLRRPAKIEEYANGGSVGRLAARMAPDAVPPRLSPLEAVKEKGGNWGGVQLGLYINDVSDLQRRRPETKAWANKQLKRYIKTYLGTAEDPMLQVERELPAPWHFASENDLEIGLAKYGAPAQARRHLRPVMTEDYDPGSAADAFHRQKTGRRTRTTWERLADGLAEYQPNVGDVTNDVLMLTGLEEPGVDSIDDALRVLGDEEALRMAGDHRAADDVHWLKPHRWLDKLDPSTRVHDLSVSPGDDPLGLSHLLDYLDQTGYTQQQMERVTFPDAVRATARWSKELAKKRETPEFMLEGTAPVKQYEDGFQWVDVLSPEALRAEGDAMGHCVGGYCDSVKDGSARILSLRDAKGRPHVTVEVDPAGVRKSIGDYEKVLDEREFGQLHNEWENAADSNTFDTFMEENYPEVFAKVHVPVIRQIKGNSNQPPADEYLPMVQDLVKTMGPWDYVHDLGNAGLIDATRALNYMRMPDKLRDLLPQHLPIEELRAALHALPMPYLTTDELVQTARGVKRRVRNAFNDAELARLKELGHDLTGVGELTAGEIDDLQKLFKGE